MRGCIDITPLVRSGVLERLDLGLLDGRVPRAAASAAPQEGPLRWPGWSGPPELVLQWQPWVQAPFPPLPPPVVLPGVLG